MGRLRSLLAAATLAVVVLTAGLAHATVVVPLSLEEQVIQSDLVVRARVGTSRSAFVPERGAILTWTELEVTDVLKGQAPSTLVLRQMGGTADGQTMYVPGDAHLVTGDDVVLVLRHDPEGSENVFLLSLAQSAWFVNGGQAQRDLTQLTYAILGQQGMQLTETGREAPIAVETLVSRIRQIAGGAR